MNRALALSLIAVVAAACGKKSEAPPPSYGSLGLDGGCQPLLAGADCLLPYPSDYFRVPDSKMPSGFRLDISSATPVAKGGLNTDPNLRFPIDGASKVPTIVTMFPQQPSKDGFVALLDDPAKSVATSSNVLIIEADTGALIPHYVDLDPRTKDLTRQAIVIHPIVGLKAKTRYVVALHGVKKADGSPMDAPKGFARLRDGQSNGDALLEKLAPHYDNDIFPVITKAGIAKADLQQAWDFTTGSDERWRTDMLDIRAQTLAWLQSNTPALSNVQITVPHSSDASYADTWYQVTGYVEGPNFLESQDPEAPLHRDANGKVAMNGTASFQFTAEVPLVVRDQFGPGMLMAYGHGFFGKQTEVTYDSTRNIAQHLGAVMFGIDWTGMSTFDVADLVEALSSRPTHTLYFADRVHQAMANWIVMTAAMRGPLASNAAFLRPASGPGTSTDGNGNSNAGTCIYAGDPVYLGISQGHILGGTMTALDPDFHRVVLHMGGAGFSHMMFRAVPFASFLGFLDQTLPDSLDEQAFAATLQPQFDRFDPATYADLMLQHPPAGTPADKQVMLQNGLGDAEVPNLGTFLDARLLGIAEATPNDYPVYGLTSAPEPVNGSALVLYDFGIDLHAEYDLAEPGGAPDGGDNRVHETLRTFVPALDQMKGFYTQGTIDDVCAGQPCVVP